MSIFIKQYFIEKKRIEDVIKKLKFPQREGENSIGMFSEMIDVKNGDTNEAILQWMWNQALSDLRQELNIKEK
mgnify:CR=1 FL=1